MTRDLANRVAKHEAARNARIRRRVRRMSDEDLIEAVATIFPPEQRDEVRAVCTAWYSGTATPEQYETLAGWYEGFGMAAEAATIRATRAQKENLDDTSGI